MIETYSLRQCEYNKVSKMLVLPVLTRFPPKAIIVSHQTGKSVEFVPVTSDDPLFDQDGWDGVQQIYRPVVHVPNVEALIICDDYR